MTMYIFILQLQFSWNELLLGRITFESGMTTQCGNCGNFLLLFSTKFREINTVGTKLRCMLILRNHFLAVRVKFHKSMLCCDDVTFGCRANNDKKVGPITQSEEIKPELTSLITLFSDNSISGFRFHCNWVLALLKVRYPATRSLGNFLIILYSAVLAKFNLVWGSDP